MAGDDLARDEVDRERPGKGGTAVILVMVFRFVIIFAAMAAPAMAAIVVIVATVVDG